MLTRFAFAVLAILGLLGRAPGQTTVCENGVCRVVDAPSAASWVTTTTPAPTVQLGTVQAYSGPPVFNGQPFPVLYTLLHPFEYRHRLQTATGRRFPVLGRLLRR